MIYAWSLSAQVQEYTLNKVITGISESGTPGLIDVNFEATMTNVNIAPLITDIQISDNVAANFGGAFVGLAQGPFIASSTALIDPIINVNYSADGADPNLLDGMSGFIAPGESVTVGYAVTVDLENTTTDLINMATGSASLTSGGATITPAPSDTAVLTDCWSDCVLACNNKVNISVNTMCEVNILADMVLEGENEECVDLGFYKVEIFDKDNNLIPLPLTAEYIGEELQVVVTNVACGNSCWGDLLVEDKTPPQLLCDSDTVSCGEDISPFNPIIGFPVDSNNITTTADSQVFIASSVDACGEVILEYSDSLVTRDCTDTLFSSVLYRKWTATDASGLMIMCTDTIYFTRGTLTNITLPPHYDGENGNPDPLQCDGDFCKLPNGFPAPEPCGTGRPEGIFCGNIQFDFWDDTISVCDSYYKILRNWLIIDWCDPDNKLEYIQKIKVVDEDGPVVIAPPRTPLVLRMQDWACGIKSYIVPEPVYDPTGANAVDNPYIPTILEECGSWTYEVRHLSVDQEIKDPNECAQVDNSQIFSTSNVRQRRDGRYELFDIPAGCNWIKYIITDDCGNSTEFSFDLFVEDAVAPIAVCHEHTVVALTSDGKARVDGSTFDDGSHDNCGLGDILVRRMVEGDCPPGIEDSTDFKEYIEFCCEDIDDNPIMVVFRVYDECGNNFSECMVEVTVQDKLPPIITECPDPVEITCEEDYTPLRQFGTAKAIDNCNVEITTDSIIDLNHCGTGTITRIFIATDDGGRSATCSQVITVVDDDPFIEDDINWPPNRNLTNGCMEDTDPDNTGRPTFRNVDDCTQLATAYEDLVFSQVDGACLKIIRQWRVIDWCQFDRDNPDECYPDNPGRFCYTQVIKVHDNEGPEFTSDCQDRSVCIDGGDCSILVTQEATAFDKCTPVDQLKWSYMIDLDNDGTFDVSGNRNSFSRVLEAGTYRVKFTVEDRCGNSEVCEYDLHVEDCKKPTPYCKNGITTVLMPTTGTVTIWASDFDAGSFDNCTDSTDLRYSFSLDITETGKTLSCDDIENGISDTIEISIYVWDEAGNVDLCKTVLILQDNQDVCPDRASLNGMIAGLISTQSSDRMKDVEVELKSPSMGASKFYMTDDEGHFAFPDMAMYEDYEVSARYDKNPMNGVSTLDLVMIQRHLLGYEDLDGPYRYIAADVNNSHSISAGDISELRKMILGVHADFPRNESWRFIDQDFQFSDVRNPFPYKEAIDINSFSKDEMASDFVAVKVGDVSGDAIPSGVIDNSTRSGDLLLTLPQPASTTSGEILVPIVVGQTEMQNILAIQFTGEYDRDLMEFVELRSGALKVQDYHVADLDQGQFTLAWSNIDAVEIGRDDVLLTAVFNPRSEIDGALPFTLTGAITPAIAYSDDRVEFNILSQGVGTTESFALYQNTPNPFKGTTNIAFELPGAMTYSIEVFDMSGKILKRVDGFGRSGYQSLELDMSGFSESSVLYYQLKTDRYSATRKMVIIE
ncbi:MAG: T9SS type A sorting domain-containing protein [Saprospiraceae bacterium]|nr:T9SS type A sorting domain-containing protein [Saprospiraceae bacterium]